MGKVIDFKLNEEMEDAYLFVQLIAVIECLPLARKRIIFDILYDHLKYEPLSITSDEEIWEA
jgi:hypothetical protein